MCVRASLCLPFFSSVYLEQHDCLLALNGGPFSFSDPTCKGRIVSDGKLVLNAKDEASSQQVRHSPLLIFMPIFFLLSFDLGQDFGLSVSKELVLGSVDYDEVAQGGFEQLLTGFNWLVLDGQVQPDAGGQVAPRTMIGTSTVRSILDQKYINCALRNSASAEW
jgi:exopolysaccharide biosynthesis protein